VETQRWTIVIRGKFEVYRSKVKVTYWERKCKIVFRAYLRQKWIDSRHTKTKMITGQLGYTQLHISLNTFHHAKMLRFALVCNQ